MRKEVEAVDASTVAEALRAALDRRGIPQWKLARHLNRHESQVSRWLADTQTMPPELVLRAAKWLMAPELRDALIAEYPWVRVLMRDEHEVADIDTWRQVRAMRDGEPVRAEVLLYPDGRWELAPSGAPLPPAA